MARLGAVALLVLWALPWANAEASGRHSLHLRVEDDVRPGPSAAELLPVLDGLAHAGQPVCQLAVDALLAGLRWDTGPLDDASARAWRATLQSRVRRPDAVALLASRLGASEACVRRFAATLLGRSDSAEAVARLRTALVGAEPAEREAAALGLGERADASDLGPLQRALEDADAHVAAAAAWALGVTGDARAVPALLQAAHHPQAHVRQAAVASLGQLEDGATASVQAALRAALADASPDVRREAAQALAH